MNSSFIGDYITSPPPAFKTPRRRAGVSGLQFAYFNAAVRASGADGLLLVRLLRVDRQTRVATNYAPMTFPGYYGFYTAWVAYPDVYQYDVATAEVNLFDVRTNKLVWGGTTETFNPSSVRRESAGFADVVITALAKRGLVPGR